MRASFEFVLSLVPETLEQKTLDLGGTIDIDGLAHAQPITGSVLVHWGNERRIRYELAFSGDDGAGYRIIGQKDFFLLAPVKSITELPFSSIAMTFTSSVTARSRSIRARSSYRR